MQVQSTETAFKDLENTLRYYQDQGVPEQGRQLVADILKRSERSANYPDSGRVVPEFGMPFLREMILPPFRVVYRREPQKIWIIRVWRSERSLDLEIPGSLNGKLEGSRAFYDPRKPVPSRRKKSARK